MSKYQQANSLMVNKFEHVRGPPLYRKTDTHTTENITLALSVTADSKKRMI